MAVGFFAHGNLPTHGIKGDAVATSRGGTSRSLREVHTHCKARRRQPTEADK